MPSAKFSKKSFVRTSELLFATVVVSHTNENCPGVIKTCGDSLSESSEVISTSSVRDAVPLRGQKGKLLCATFPTFFDVAFHVRRSSVPPAPGVEKIARLGTAT